VKSLEEVRDKFVLVVPSDRFRPPPWTVSPIATKIHALELEGTATFSKKSDRLHGKSLRLRPKSPHWSLKGLQPSAKSVKKGDPMKGLMTQLRRVTFVCLLTLSLMLVVLSVVRTKTVHGQDRTDSGQYNVSHANGQCKDNACSTQGGCAACQQLVVNLPAGAQVDSIHCYTTAAYPNDTGIHEVSCTTDNSWSVFDQPVIQTSPGGGVNISTTYHNRSHNRGRTVKLSVDWHLPKN
jgi:hypothetical protein